MKPFIIVIEGSSNKNVMLLIKSVKAHSRAHTYKHSSTKQKYALKTFRYAMIKNLMRNPSKLQNIQ